MSWAAIPRYPPRDGIWTFTTLGCGHIRAIGPGMNAPAEWELVFCFTCREWQDVRAFGVIRR